MIAFPMANMAEATRLTRLGRLAEAMALLKGQPASVPWRAGASRRRRR